jgi:late competence protein required for DNA uptake (superfamily II DNA/RNA helicase)
MSLDNYFDDLAEYQEDLFCNQCGESDKRIFNYIRTVSNGEVFYCQHCDVEKIVSNKPNEDNY